MSGKVLLVDDNEADNVYHNRVFRKLGAEERLVVYDSSQEAMDFLKDETQAASIDLVFVDINMPVMDGWTFVERLDQTGFEKPVVMMSSSMNPDDHSRAMSYRCVQEYLIKPLTREVLGELLKSSPE